MPRRTDDRRGSRTKMVTRRGSTDQALMKAQMDVQEALTIIKFKGGVEWTDLMKLEAIHWAFVLLASSLCVFKGPRLYTSTRAGELGVFLPLGLRGFISVRWMSHLLIVNLIGSGLTIASTRSAIGRQIREWKLATIKIMASAMASVLFFEFLVLNPLCSQSFWPSWSTLRGWWLFETTKSSRDISLSEIRANVEERVETIKEAVNTVKSNFDGIPNIFKRYDEPQLQVNGNNDVTREITEKTLRRLGATDRFSSVIGWMMECLGGCASIHHVLWMVPLTIFSYAWLLLSIAAVPFAIKDDFKSVIPWAFRPQGLSNFAKTSDKMESVEGGLNELVIFEGYIRDKSVILQVPSDDRGLPSGFGSWWQRGRNVLTMVDGLWVKGNLRSPYVARDPMYGVFRSIPLICLDIDADQEAVRIDQGSAIMCNTRLIDCMTSTKYMKKAPYVSTNNLISPHRRSRSQRGGGTEEDRSLLDQVSWMVALESILNDWNEQDERRGLDKRPVILLVHADHSNLSSSGRHVAVHTAGNVASDWSIQQSRANDLTHLDEAAMMPLVVVVNLKASLVHKFLSYILLVRKIDALRWKASLSEIDKTITRTGNEVVRLLVHGIAIDPILHLAGRQEWRNTELVLFGIQDLLLVSTNYALEMTSITSLVEKAHQINRNVFVFAGTDRVIIKLWRDYEMSQFTNKDDWLRKKAKFRNPRVRFMVRKSLIGSTRESSYPSLRSMLVAWNRVMRTIVNLWNYFADAESTPAWDVSAVDTRVMAAPVSDQSVDLLVGSTFLYS